MSGSWVERAGVDYGGGLHTAGMHTAAAPHASCVARNKHHAWGGQGMGEDKGRACSCCVTRLPVCPVLPATNTTGGGAGLLTASLACPSAPCCPQQTPRVRPRQRPALQ